MDTLYLLIFLTVAVGFAGWLLFLWAVKSGQYDDVEGPKYRMMDDEDEDRFGNIQEKEEQKKNKKN